MQEQGKSRVLLWNEVYKFIKETEEENLYICDGKNDSYTELCKGLFEIVNVESDFHRIGETVRKIENHGATMTVKKRDASGIFVIDEFIALRIALDKKEFAEITDGLRRPIDRAATFTITLALQRPKISALDGAIRDNYPVSDWFRNLKDEISRWYLYHKDDSIIHKEIGHDISINDVLMVMNFMGDFSLGQGRRFVVFEECLSRPRTCYRGKFADKLQAFPAIGR